MRTDTKAFRSRSRYPDTRGTIDEDANDVHTQPSPLRSDAMFNIQRCLAEAPPPPKMPTDAIMCSS